MSQQCRCATLVKIYSFIHETGCRLDSYIKANSKTKVCDTPDHISLHGRENKETTNHGHRGLQKHEVKIKDASGVALSIGLRKCTFNV